MQAASRAPAAPNMIMRLITPPLVEERLTFPHKGPESPHRSQTHQRRHACAPTRAIDPRPSLPVPRQPPSSVRAGVGGHAARRRRDRGRVTRTYRLAARAGRRMPVSQMILARTAVPDLTETPTGGHLGKTAVVATVSTYSPGLSRTKKWPPVLVRA